MGGCADVDFLLGGEVVGWDVGVHVSISLSSVSHFSVHWWQMSIGPGPVFLGGLVLHCVQSFCWGGGCVGLVAGFMGVSMVSFGGG